MSRDTLLLAGGAVAAGFVSSYIISAFGPTKNVSGVQVLKASTDFVLPGLRPGADGKVNPLIVAAYAIALPVLGAMLIRRQSPGLAKGLLLGGAITGVSTVVGQVQGALTRGGSSVAQLPATSGAAAYLDAPFVPGVSASPIPSAGYSAVQAFSASPLQNSSAFADNAWAE